MTCCRIPARPCFPPRQAGNIAFFCKAAPWSYPLPPRKEDNNVTQVTLYLLKNETNYNNCEDSPFTNV